MSNYIPKNLYLNLSSSTLAMVSGAGDKQLLSTIQIAK